MSKLLPLSENTGIASILSTKIDMEVAILILALAILIAILRKRVSNRERHQNK